MFWKSKEVSTEVKSSVNVFVPLCLGDLLHELSNDGAKDQFQYFVEQFILPVMVSSAKVNYPLQTV